MLVNLIILSAFFFILLVFVTYLLIDCRSDVELLERSESMLWLRLFSSEEKVKHLERVCLIDEEIIDIALFGGKNE